MGRALSAKLVRLGEGGVMKLRSLSLAVVCVLVLAGSAMAQPGTAFLEGRGGALIPARQLRPRPGSGRRVQHRGRLRVPALPRHALRVHARLQSSDNDNEQFSVGNLHFKSEETHQNFIVALGPRASISCRRLPGPALRDREGRLVSLRELQQRRGERHQPAQRQGPGCRRDRGRARPHGHDLHALRARERRDPDVGDHARRRTAATTTRSSPVARIASS